MPTPDGDPPNRRGRPAHGPSRLPRAIRVLEPEQRIAAGAALALWVSMFLPWYGKSVTETIKNSLRAAGYDLSAFGAFSFVEAAVLLVASAVLALLFARAERRAFHLPGGDGLVILTGGIWVSVLIFYRMLDKPGTTGNDRLTTTVGLQWGIFFALAASISLAYAGARVRAAHHPEPSLRDDPTVSRRVVSRRPPRLPATQPPGRPADRSESTVARRPPGPPESGWRTPAPPFDADADADETTQAAAAPARPRFPPAPPDPQTGRTPDEPTLDLRTPTAGPFDDPPTRSNRRVPRFDDLDAEWISADQMPIEADPPTRPDRDR